MVLPVQYLVSRRHCHPNMDPRLRGVTNEESEPS